MLTKPKGWLIMDSFNNKYFPMDIIRFDTMTSNVSKVQNEFHKIYGGNIRDLFLPWHYTIEIIDEKPFVFQTRPPMYRSKVPGFENHMVIMIIGDSNSDLYGSKYYKMIAHNLINPYHYIPGLKVGSTQEHITFWTGEGFHQNKLFKEIM